MKFDVGYGKIVKNEVLLKTKGEVRSGRGQKCCPSQTYIAKTFLQKCIIWLQ